MTQLANIAIDVSATDLLALRHDLEDPEAWAGHVSATFPEKAAAMLSNKIATCRRHMEADAVAVLHADAPQMQDDRLVALAASAGYGDRAAREAKYQAVSLDGLAPPGGPEAETPVEIELDGQKLELVEADRVALSSAFIAAQGGAAVPVKLKDGTQLSLRLVDITRIMEAWHGVA